MAQAEDTNDQQGIIAVEAAFDPSSSTWSLGPIMLFGAGLCCCGLLLGCYVIYRAICCKSGAARPGRGLRTSSYKKPPKGRHTCSRVAHADDGYEDEYQEEWIAA